MKYKYVILGLIIGLIIVKFYVFFKINIIKLFEIITNYFKP